MRSNSPQTDRFRILTEGQLVESDGDDDAPQQQQHATIPSPTTARDNERQFGGTLSRAGLGSMANFRDRLEERRKENSDVPYNFSIRAREFLAVGFYDAGLHLAERDSDVVGAAVAHCLSGHPGRSVAILEDYIQDCCVRVYKRMKKINTQSMDVTTLPSPMPAEVKQVVETVCKVVSMQELHQWYLTSVLLDADYEPPTQMWVRHIFSLFVATKNAKPKEEAKPQTRSALPQPAAEKKVVIQAAKQLTPEIVERIMIEQCTEAEIAIVNTYVSFQLQRNRSALESASLVIKKLDDQDICMRFMRAVCALRLGIRSLATEDITFLMRRPTLVFRGVGNMMAAYAIPMPSALSAIKPEQLSTAEQEFLFSVGAWTHGLTLLQLGQHSAALQVARSALPFAPRNPWAEWISDVGVTAAIAVGQSTPIREFLVSPIRQLHLALCNVFGGGFDRGGIKTPNDDVAPLLSVKFLALFCDSRQSMVLHTLRARALFSFGRVEDAWQEICVACEAAEELLGTVEFAMCDCAPHRVLQYGIKFGLDLLERIIEEGDGDDDDDLSPEQFHKRQLDDAKGDAIIEMTKAWSQKLRAITPKTTGSYCAVVNVMIAAHDPSSVERAVTLTELFPRNVVAMNLLSLALYMKHLIPDAKFHSQRALNAFPHVPETKKNYRDINGEEGMYVFMYRGVLPLTFTDGKLKRLGGRTVISIGLLIIHMIIFLATCFFNMDSIFKVDGLDGLYKAAALPVKIPLYVGAGLLVYLLIMVTAPRSLITVTFDEILLRKSRMNRFLFGSRQIVLVNVVNAIMVMLSVEDPLWTGLFWLQALLILFVVSLISFPFTSRLLLLRSQDEPKLPIPYWLAVIVVDYITFLFTFPAHMLFAFTEPLFFFLYAFFIPSSKEREAGDVYDTIMESGEIYSFGRQPPIRFLYVRLMKALYWDTHSDRSTMHALKDQQHADDLRVFPTIRMDSAIPTQPREPPAKAAAASKVGATKLQHMHLTGMSAQERAEFESEQEQVKLMGMSKSLRRNSEGASQPSKPEEELPTVAESRRRQSVHSITPSEKSFSNSHGKIRLDSFRKPQKKLNNSHGNNSHSKLSQSSGSDKMPGTFRNSMGGTGKHSSMRHAAKAARIDALLQCDEKAAANMFSMGRVQAKRQSVTGVNGSAPPSGHTSRKGSTASSLNLEDSDKDDLDDLDLTTPGDFGEVVQSALFESDDGKALAPPGSGKVLNPLSNNPTPTASPAMVELPKDIDEALQSVGSMKDLREAIRREASFGSNPRGSRPTSRASAKSASPQPGLPRASSGLSNGSSRPSPQPVSLTSAMQAAPPASSTSPKIGALKKKLAQKSEERSESESPEVVQMARMPSNYVDVAEEEEPMTIHVNSARTGDSDTNRRQSNTNSSDGNGLPPRNGATGSGILRRSLDSNGVSQNNSNASSPTAAGPMPLARRSSAVTILTPSTEAKLEVAPTTGGGQETPQQPDLGPEMASPLDEAEKKPIQDVHENSLESTSESVTPQRSPATLHAPSPPQHSHNSKAPIRHSVSLDGDSGNSRPSSVPRPPRSPPPPSMSPNANRPLAVVTSESPAATPQEKSIDSAFASPQHTPRRNFARDSSASPSTTPRGHAPNVVSVPSNLKASPSVSRTNSFTQGTNGSKKSALADLDDDDDLLTESESSDSDDDRAKGKKGKLNAPLGSGAPTRSPSNLSTDSNASRQSVSAPSGTQPRMPGAMARAANRVMASAVAGTAVNALQKRPDSTPEARKSPRPASEDYNDASPKTNRKTMDFLALAAAKPDQEAEEARKQRFRRTSSVPQTMREMLKQVEAKEAGQVPKGTNGNIKLRRILDELKTVRGSIKASTDEEVSGDQGRMEYLRRTLENAKLKVVADVEKIGERVSVESVDTKSQVTSAVEDMVNETDRHPGNGQLVRCLVSRIYTIDFATIVIGKGWLQKVAADGSPSYLETFLKVPEVATSLTVQDARKLIATCVRHKQKKAPLMLVMAKCSINCIVFADEKEKLEPVWQEAFEIIASNVSYQSGDDRTGRYEALELMMLHPCIQIDFGREARDKQTIFSRAAREGDLKLVASMIHRKKILDLNRVQSDNTNALMQAAARNMTNIVEYLCKQDNIAPSFSQVLPGKGTVIEIALGMKRDPVIINTLRAKANALGIAHGSGGGKNQQQPEFLQEDSTGGGGAAGDGKRAGKLDDKIPVVDATNAFKVLLATIKPLYSQLKHLESIPTPDRDEAKRLREMREDLGKSKENIVAKMGRLGERLDIKKPEVLDDLLKLLDMMISETDAREGNVALFEAVEDRVIPVDMAQLSVQRRWLPECCTNGSLAYLTMFHELPGMKKALTSSVTRDMLVAARGNRIQRANVTLNIVDHYDVHDFAKGSIVLSPPFQDLFEDIASTQRAFPQEVRHRRMELIKKMIRDPNIRVDIDREGGDMQTVLSRAAAEGDADLVALILRSKASKHANNVNSDGSTALTQAIRAGHVAVVQEMLPFVKSNGGELDLNVETSEGTALDVVDQYRQENIMMLRPQLVKSGARNGRARAQAAVPQHGRRSPGPDDRR